MLRSLPKDAQAGLLALQERMADVAERSTVEDFARTVRQEANRLLSEADKEARLARQKAQVRLSTWIDPASGMGCWRATWDPQTTQCLDSKLDAMVESLFRDGHPDGCPTDPREKQQFLRAHALLSIIEGNGIRLSKPEATIVIHGDGNGRAVVDYDLPVDLPLAVLRDLLGRADVRTVVVGEGSIISALGRLNPGSASRFANGDQRRALQALYRTCAVPGCRVPYRRTELHHVDPYQVSKNTNLDNLIPICKHHHDLIHQHDWHLHLAADRSLTITLPDRTTMSTGPPSRRTA